MKETTRDLWRLAIGLFAAWTSPWVWLKCLNCFVAGGFAIWWVVDAIEDEMWRERFDRWLTRFQ